MDVTGLSSSGGRIDGLVSGFDTTSIINQLAEVRRVPITQLQTRKTSEQAMLAAYQSLGAGLLSLGSQAARLQSAGTFSGRTVSNSRTDLVTASVSSGAASGAYELVVEQLAQAHKIASGTVADAEAALGYSGSVVINHQAIAVRSDDSLNDIVAAINDADAGVSASVLTVGEDDHRLVLTATQSGLENAIDLVDANSGGILEQLGLTGSLASTKHAITGGMASDYLSSDSGAVAEAMGLVSGPSGSVTVGGVAVAIDLATDSLQSIADRITASVSGVTASVTSAEVDGATQWRLEIAGASGAPELADSSNILQTLGVLTKGVGDEVVAAQDARFTLDGFTINRASNSVDDVVTGLSLELTEADPDAKIGLRISPDQRGAATEVQSLVSKFNDIMGMLNSGLSYDSEAQTGGTFFGEATIMTLQASLTQQTTQGVGTLAGLKESTSLSEIGLSVAQDGKLNLDTQTLQKALAADPLRVQRLLGTTVWATSAEVEFVAAGSRTADSGMAGYAVSITQAATRATATSASLAGGIAQDETLTFNGAYQVTLTAGATLQQATDTLNSFFQSNRLSIRASVEGDKLSLSHTMYGSAYRIQVSSSLNKGAGGLDIGAAAAGESATYAGLDVAGTINGEAATGQGQLLTGDDSNTHTAGLQLRVAASAIGDKGTITLSKGLGTRLKDLTDQATQSERGSLTLGQNAVSDRISGIDSEIERLDNQVDSYIETLQREFTAMEKTLAKMQTLGSWLTTQIDTMTKQSNS
jgi:flagellar hook-associated protein 2